MYDEVIRRLEHSDADAYRQLLEGATDEERYFRFFRPVRDVDSSMVEPFVTSSGSMLALLAEDRDGRLLGTAHAFLDNGGRRAELAILVAHGSQHHGIGTRLMEHLIGELRNVGCTELVALSLDCNYRFANLARGLGMTVRVHQLGVLTWGLALGQPSARPPADQLARAHRALAADVLDRRAPAEARLQARP